MTEHNATEPEREECGHTPEEHERLGESGQSLGDVLAAIMGVRPVMVRDGYPFVVIQMIPNPDAPDTGYGLDISAGCIPNKETMAAILLDTVGQMNGLTKEEELAFLGVVDARRAAIGLRSVVEYGFKDVPDEDATEPAAESEPATN